MENHLLFSGSYLLTVSTRGSGVLGMADSPWSRLTAEVFYPNLSVIYSVALRTESPDGLRGSLRARRTLFEGFVLALSKKIGHCPSMAERHADHAVTIWEVKKLIQ